MELIINDLDKIIEIWMTNEEQNDIFLRKSLKDIYNEYNIKNYKVAVFESGKADLFSQTKDLLLHNRIL